MVKTLINILNNGKVQIRSPFVAELVGPAGAGKTTLCQALSRRCEDLIVSRHPFSRKLSDVTFFTKQFFFFVKTLFLIYNNIDGSRWPTKREIAWMAVLNRFHHFLERRGAKLGKAFVLDQGPVYLLAELHVLGPICIRNRGFDNWWNDVYSQWATTLDMVVVLDAADTVLKERIQYREKGHIMKSKTKSEICEFLDRYRVAYDQVLRMMIAKCKNLRILRINTLWESVDEISSRLLTEFGLEANEKGFKNGKVAEN
jgi:shikimate kinase